MAMSLRSCSCSVRKTVLIGFPFWRQRFGASSTFPLSAVPERLTGVSITHLLSAINHLGCGEDRFQPPPAPAGGGHSQAGRADVVFFNPAPASGGHRAVPINTLCLYQPPPNPLQRGTTSCPPPAEVSRSDGGGAVPPASEAHQCAGMKTLPLCEVAGNQVLCLRKQIFQELLS